MPENATIVTITTTTVKLTVTNITLAVPCRASDCGAVCECRASNSALFGVEALFGV